MTQYINHPLIRKDSVEERTYQLSVALKALEANTMVVLPTGLGKTAVALITAASRLYNSGGKFLMLAPTKPLVEQHLRFFRKHLLTKRGAEPAESDFAMFTGETPTDERGRIWETVKVCFATPQVIKNDLLARRYNLKEVSLLIVDECHRAVGNYAYVFIADEYVSTAGNPRVLAMTASPGSDPSKVAEVCENLHISQVESRTESDPDVSPYVHERTVDYITVDLPPELAGAVDTINRLMEERLKKIAKLNFRVPPLNRLSIRTLNELNGQIQSRIARRDATAYSAASLHAELMKLRHAVALAESQGSIALATYLGRIISEGSSPSGSKAGKRLASDPRLLQLHALASGWEREMHPKADILAEKLGEQLESDPESRIIVFASYRDTVNMLAGFLEERGIDARRFVGQASRDSEKGLSQKKQIETLSRFREGEFRVLIATSVGEEGLDVPSTDLVVFYEAVPSEIRSIQRKGRTGRSGSGKIIVLVTKGTTDEAFRYVSQQREKSMAKGIRSMQTAPEEKTAVSGEKKATSPSDMQASIGSFSAKGPKVAVDDRETSSAVVEELHRTDAGIEIRRLDSGDYAVGERVLIERKTVNDFLNTLVDRDLFGQLSELRRSSPRPILIVEGREDIYSVRNIHPNSIRGMLSAIMVDFGIPVIFTPDEKETAAMIYAIARREEKESGERQLHAHKTMATPSEEVEEIISSFPGVGPKHARILLREFGSVKAIVESEKEELMKIKGIGEKTASSIYETSRRGYRRTQDF